MAEKSVNFEGAGTSTVGRPITCKAAVVWKPKEKFKIENVIVAAPRQKQVRIKILYTAICHTDITFAETPFLAHKFPLVCGHEAVGIVESVGEGVTKVHVGDHVIPYIYGQCDHCFSCTAGVSNVCKSRPRLDALITTIAGDPEPHFTTEDGTVLYRLFGMSTFSEYTVVHAEQIVKMRPELPLENACLLGCGVSTGYGAVWNVAKVRTGATVAVFGLGTIGLSVVQACKMSGASRIIGLDINSKKFETGKSFGVTDFINPKEQTKPAPQVIKELIEGGVDYSFECSGAAGLIEDAVESTETTYGVTVIVGVPSNPSATFSINIFSFMLGKTIIGTLLGGCQAKQISEFADKCLVSETECPLDGYVTNRLPLSQINEGLEIFHSGDCLRCVLHVDGV